MGCQQHSNQHSQLDGGGGGGGLCMLILGKFRKYLVYVSMQTYSSPNPLDAIALF